MKLIIPYCKSLLIFQLFSLPSGQDRHSERASLTLSCRVVALSERTARTGREAAADSDDIYYGDSVDGVLRKTHNPDRLAPL